MNRAKAAWLDAWNYYGHPALTLSNGMAEFQVNGCAWVYPASDLPRDILVGCAQAVAMTPLEIEWDFEDRMTPEFLILLRGRNTNSIKADAMRIFEHAEVIVTSDPDDALRQEGDLTVEGAFAATAGRALAVVANGGQTSLQVPVTLACAKHNAPWIIVDLQRDGMRILATRTDIRQ